ncbi:MAG: hypothetical protein IH859_06405, partial [Chloroflexi bacterium]|nr:hypothetical protein [Chloroflexota bacterium]
MAESKPKIVERYSSAAAALLVAAASISNKIEVQEVAEEAAHQLVDVLGMDACLLSKWDQDANTITLWAEYTRTGEKMLVDWRQPENLADYPVPQQVLQKREFSQVQ